MTVNPRRPGFRLPWTDDGDESGDGSQTAQATADPGSEAHVTEPATASASSDAAVVGRQTSAEIAEAAGAEGASPATQATANATAEATAEPTDEPPDTPSEEAASAEAARADAAPVTDGADFLASLVSAMRGVAEEARDTSISELRTTVDERVEQLRTAAAERADDLRRRAELDLAAIEDWERTEIERVKSEAQHRAETRRQQLEQQLADHQAATDLETEATRQRLGDHERELDAFFTQLSSVSDPAAFVAAAKRMPQPPDLTGSSAAASPAAPATLNRRLEALGIHRAPIRTASDPAPAGEAADEVGADEPAIDDGSAEAWDSADVATDVAPDATASASPTDQASSPDQPESATRTGVLAERLAQLDERLSGATATPAAATDDADTETSTAIVVKGLGSFGAITSFKQALERVEGIRGVTLSLGPTGEFVYRATHLAGFDLLAAIRSVEGQTVEIEQEDGALRVTVSRSR